jgi:NFU1 iron-sulfur cluster scaffold homolog, mitochondrial
VSPFEGGGADVAGSVLMELTEANVDAALDAVRPMLVADGGNISVLSLSDGPTPASGKTVTVQLEGACGVCPSSASTMRLGVERALRAAFGPALGDVIAVAEPAAAAARRALSVEACDRALDEVRPVLAGLSGCAVKTRAVEGGVVRLEYNGPTSLRFAIDLMLKDTFPGVVSVVYEE